MRIVLDQLVPSEDGLHTSCASFLPPPTNRTLEVRRGLHHDRGRDAHARGAPERLPGGRRAFPATWEVPQRRAQVCLSVSLMTLPPAVRKGPRGTLALQ